MNCKQQLFAALACHANVLPLPVWEIEFQAWDAASGRHVILGHEFEALSAAEQERAMYQNAEILLGVADDFGYAALSIPSGYWDEAPGKLAYYCLPGDTRYRQAEILRELAPAELVLVGNSGGVMAMPGAWNYLEFAYQLFDAPEEIDQQARGSCDWGIATARRLQDVGIEIVVTASDIADNRGPYFTPEQLERFVMPYVREWASAVKSMGLYSIMHTDGNIMPFIGLLAETELHAVQAIDPTAGMTMRAAQEKVQGRLCLCGNIDCGLLLTGTPDEVFQSTTHLLAECAPDGGVILGTSNAVQPVVPMENYRAMLAANREYQT